MNKQATTIEDIATRIDFRGDYVLLAEAQGCCSSVYGGGNSVLTTRLIANCIYEDQLGKYGDSPTAGAVQQAGPEGTKMEALIDQMRRVEGERFIICYCADEDGRWHMKWSADLTPDEAYEEMMQYVRGGCP